MSATDANPGKRTLAECLGVVHRRFAENDPPVVGTQFVRVDPARGFEVRFLLPAERDVARSSEELLPRLVQALADALTLHEDAPDPDDVRVTLSSLEGQGIRTRYYR